MEDPQTPKQLNSRRKNTLQETAYCNIESTLFLSVVSSFRKLLIRECETLRVLQHAPFRGNPENKQNRLL